jgi:hypothetical protein
LRVHTKVSRRARGAALIAIGLLAGGLAPLAAAGAGNPASVPSAVVPLDPQRILDTRAAVGIDSVTPLAAEQTITLQVAGVAGVPADATGVVLNLTVNAATGAGYVTAYPAGGGRPTASVINYTAGEDVANMITATLGAGGAIELYNAQASVHLIADVAGYLAPVSGAPPAPPGPAGLQFDRGAINRPPVGAGAFVDLGTIDGATIQFQCGGPVASALRVSTTSSVGFNGAFVRAGAAASVESVDVSSAGPVIIPITGLTQVSATLRLPNLGLAHLEATLGPVNSSSCVAIGSVIPPP